MTLLSANQLTIRINEHPICDHFNFSLRSGEIWGLLGPNGCGKTTLLHTLAGLSLPTAGTITLQGDLLTKLTAKTIARQIGILFQSLSDTFPQTVLEYITASRFPHLAYYEKENAHDKNIIHAALDEMNLHPFKHRLIQQLSGGEKRRLAIAALLAQTPRIFMLDEPTNHLDMHYQLRVLAHFQKLAQREQAGIIMSLHDANLAQAFCTHILLMFQNGDMQQGKVCDILSEENLSRLYDVRVRAVPQGDQFIWHYI